MVELRGKFIFLTCSLMGLYKTKQEEADQIIKEKTGKGFKELDPEGWYDLEIYRAVVEKYREASISKDRAYTTLGQKIYPTIHATVGLPKHLLENPLEFLKFEAEGYKENVRGDGIIPRKFLKTVEGEVIIQAINPDIIDKTVEGVFMGIMDLCQVKNYKIEKLEDSTYRITWSK
ncbi:hypothetical protein [Leptospira ilyithenensis]|uniref:DUF2378 family protein n=1 Tax=Leptospira ilyithenensis TaxID=2484901 RepID=A0A4R9LQR3_9LEPT|nr:hypothetical protein [Leptospira ilyithenensis]TGN11851.1 hypothetical protein EHS11_04900 [Leptospira ilyithenensis]